MCTFSYTVAAADYDADGVSIPANAIDTMGNTWLSVGSVPVPLNNAALGDQSAHRVIGAAASISSTTPAALDSTVLDGATIDLTLSGVTFGSGVAASSFELVTAMTGVSISGVSSVSSGDTSATLTLSAPADVTDAAPLAVKVLATAHSGSLDLTTATVSVTQLVSAGSGASTDTRALSVEEGSMVGWDVVLSADPGAGCTGGVTIGITSGDTAAVTVSPATLTFTTANWDTAQTVTATGVEDGDLADETATISHMVTATGCAAAYPTGLSIAGVTVSVDDDDTSLFSIDSPRAVEGDSGSTTMTFTVTLSPPASVQATVDYAWIWVDGSASSPSDHPVVSGGTLTFAPGVTTQTIPVTVNGDTMEESDERVGLQLSNSTPSGFVIATGMGDGTGDHRRRRHADADDRFAARGGGELRDHGDGVHGDAVAGRRVAGDGGVGGSDCRHWHCGVGERLHGALPPQRDADLRHRRDDQDDPGGGAGRLGGRTRRDGGGGGSPARIRPGRLSATRTESSSGPPSASGR